MTRKSLPAPTGTARQGVRLVWLAIGVATMAVVGAWAAVASVAMIQSGHPVRGALLGIATLLLLLVGLLVAAAQWRRAGTSAEQPLVPSDANDQTGIWGVGAPSMREPGTTGNWPARRVDRRYESPQD